MYLRYLLCIKKFGLLPSASCLVNRNVTDEKCLPLIQRNSSNRPETTNKRDFCGRDGFSHIGLYNDKRRCNSRTDRATMMHPHDQT